MQRTTTYREQSRIFLSQAYEELAKGDLQQASEKGWGAASQMVKAIAQERGWRHRSHRHLQNAVVIKLRTSDQVTEDPRVCVLVRCWREPASSTSTRIGIRLEL